MCFLLLAISFESVLCYQFLQRINAVFVERRYHFSECIGTEFVRKIGDAFVAFDFDDDKCRVRTIGTVTFEVIKRPFRHFGKCGMIAFELMISSC